MNQQSHSYLSEVKMYVHLKTSFWIFMATLSIIAKMWKQLYFPSTDEIKIIVY